MDVASLSAGNRLLIKLGIVAVLALLMLIPLALVHGVLDDREGYLGEVRAQIGQQWGSAQSITGPLLVVPFVELVEYEVEDVNQRGESRTVKKTRRVNHRAVFLPEQVEMRIDIDTEYRHRAIYDVLVYTAKIAVVGRFGALEIPSSTMLVQDVRWEQAHIALGLSQTQGVSEISALTWDREELSFAPGTSLAGTLPRGFHAGLGGWDHTQDNFEFAWEMTVRGSGSVGVAPVGERTTVKVKSRWPHPGFVGTVLPDRHDIGADGFEADWSIPNLVRNYPQRWVSGARDVNLAEGWAGVELVERVGPYSVIDRAIKYGILFVVLTFISFVLFELLAGAPVHYLQLTLVGLGLVLFYLTLLALSEHVSFILGYFIAASVIVLLLSLYAAAVLGRWIRGVWMGCLLSGLYVVLFVLLQLEDFALLTGTALLIVALAALMYLTRNLDTLGSAS